MAKATKTLRPTRDVMDEVGEMFGIPRPHDLDLARPMRLDIGRIGYNEEGLRLTISIDSPYQFNAEVKLSRDDVTWLIQRLQTELANPKNVNLPKGRTHAD